MDEILYTTEELAKFLRSSVPQIHNLSSLDHDGTKLPKSIRVGRRRLWPESAIKEWISAQLTNQEASACKATSQPQPKTINRI